jgi:hypothetical protein
VNGIQDIRKVKELENACAKLSKDVEKFLNKSRKPSIGQNKKTSYDINEED